MIKEVTMYKVVCDQCGADSLEDSDYAAVGEKWWAEDCASEADFQDVDGKDYCPKCYVLDEETDDYVVKILEGE